MVSDLPVIRIHTYDPMYYLAVMIRLWNSVIEDENGCWVWQGHKNHHGYGTFSYKNENRLAYNISYIIFRKKPITPGKVLHHNCRNRACINPYHLVEVTKKFNALEGIGPTAINARKTHCIRGHSLAEDKIYRKKGNGRVCKICHYQSSRRKLLN